MFLKNSKDKCICNKYNEYFVNITKHLVRKFKLNPDVPQESNGCSMVLRPKDETEIINTISEL